MQGAGLGDRRCNTQRVPPKVFLIVKDYAFLVVRGDGDDDDEDDCVMVGCMITRDTRD